MTVQFVLVNAGSPLPDAGITAFVPALQYWADTMVQPGWNLEPAVFSFMPWAEFAANTPDLSVVKPLFFNNHSTDSGILGFHDFKDGHTFGRVFAGDCLRAIPPISWTVDASHEVVEAWVNPVLTRYKTLPNGDVALVEPGDPVESDEFGIPVVVDNVTYLLTDFALPSYFDGAPGPWDYRWCLTGPCPTLTPGGYQSVFPKGGADWTQLTAMQGGRLSARAERFIRSHRYPTAPPV